MTKLIISNDNISKLADLSLLALKLFSYSTTQKASEFTPPSKILSFNYGRLGVALDELRATDLFSSISCRKVANRHKLTAELNAGKIGWKKDNKYAYINVNELLSFRRKSTVSLYFHLLKFRKKGKIACHLYGKRGLLSMLGVKSKRYYERPSLFNTDWLQPAKEELISKTSITITNCCLKNEVVYIDFQVGKKKELGKVKKSQPEEEIKDQSLTTVKSAKKIAPIPEFSEEGNTLYTGLVTKKITKKTAKEAINTLGVGRIKCLIKQIWYRNDIAKKNAYLHTCLIQELADRKLTNGSLQSNADDYGPPRPGRPMEETFFSKPTTMSHAVGLCISQLEAKMSSLKP